MTRGPRRYTMNRDDVAMARRIRRTFMDRAPEHEDVLQWSWPRAMVDVGTCEAVMYASDKWRSDERLIDYKHVAEELDGGGNSKQRLLVVPGFLREYFNTRQGVGIEGDELDLHEMPEAFAVLAPILGLQARLYEEQDGELVLPDDEYYQIDIANAWLGGAEHPATGQKFLLVYTKTAGVCCIVTGGILDIKADGIVG
jgi:hypothetical protein